VLTLAQNSYTYSAYEDTGTGKAYSNLILFDLALFETSNLPIVIHDSYLYKNVENNAVAEFIKLYISIGKQSFISIDEFSKYGDDVKKLITQKQVLKLSNNNMLYIKDWRKAGSRKA
jgi:RNase adaptor protein for sRNA GlmZ degradation